MQNLVVTLDSGWLLTCFRSSFAQRNECYQCDNKQQSHRTAHDTANQLFVLVVGLCPWSRRFRGSRFHFVRRRCRRRSYG